MIWDCLSVDLLPWFARDGQSPEDPYSYPFLPIYRLVIILLSAFSWHALERALRSRLDPKWLSLPYVQLTHSLWQFSVFAFIGLDLAGVLFGKEYGGGYWHPFPDGSSPSAAVWDLPPNYMNPIRGIDKLFAVTVGYYLFDFYICVKNGWRYDLFFHCFCCFTAFGSVLVTGMLQRFTVMSLSFELSTLFFMQFQIHEDFRPRYATVMGLLFAITFGLARVLGGSFICYEVWSSLVFEHGWAPSGKGIPLWASILTVSLQTSFQCLNLYWFARICKGVLRHFRKGLLRHFRIQMRLEYGLASAFALSAIATAYFLSNQLAFF